MNLTKKLSLLGIILGSITIQTTSAQNPQANGRAGFFKLQPPKIINPATVTPATLSQKNDEILSLKKQLNANLEKNPALQKLHKEKKEVKQRIAALITSIQTKQSQNKQTLQQFQEAKTKKDLPIAPLQIKVNALRQEAKNLQLQLTQYYNKLQELKVAMKRADPSRQSLIKKLHSANQELLAMRLAQSTKSKEN